MYLEHTALPYEIFIMEDVIGKKYGKLTVVRKTHKNSNYECFVDCLCECGNVKNIMLSNLKRGGTKSCGCYLKNKLTKHGYARKGERKTYSCWYAMTQRCINIKDKNYHNYGGRGISFCERRKSFILFLEDMGQISDGLSLDRIDNNKGYCKENCRWATTMQQNSNRRDNVWIKFEGLMYTQSSLARMLGKPISTISLRRRGKWLGKENVCFTDISK